MARDNVARFHGAAPNWTLVLADVARRHRPAQADRMVLDLPEPWRLLGAAAAALRPGGVLVVLRPDGPAGEAARRQALRAEPRFARREMFETLQRFWHVRRAQYGRSIAWWRTPASSSPRGGWRTKPDPACRPDFMHRPIWPM